MAITSVIDTSNRVPGTYIAVQFGVGPSNAGDAPIRVCLVGHKTSAGSWAANTPVQLFSEEDAIAGAGAGSELHRMVRAAYAAFRGATLWAVPLDEPSGAAAAKAITFDDGPAAADGMYVIEVCGERIEVGVTAGDTVTDIGDAVEDAINARPHLPVTASNSVSEGVATVTVTAKTKGTRGNNITLRSSGTVNSVTAGHASGTLTSGSGTDTLTSALAAMDPERFHRIAVAHDDTTTIQSWRDHVNDNAGPTEGRRQQVIAATRAALGTAIASATSVNAARVQICWHYNADDLPSEVAAAVAATRAELEARDPAAPMSQAHGTVVAGLRPQPVVADRPLQSELKSALDNGLTPLSLDGAGNVYICRSITSRSQDTSGNPNYATLDTSKVTVPDFVADDLTVWWASFAPNNSKLAPDDPDGNAPPPGVATPTTIKDGIYARLKALEPEYIVNVDLNLPNLVVEIADSPDGRVNALVPADVVEGAYQLAAAVQQVG